MMVEAFWWLRPYKIWPLIWKKNHVMYYPIPSISTLICHLLSSPSTSPPPHSHSSATILLIIFITRLLIAGIQPRTSHPSVVICVINPLRRYSSIHPSHNPPSACSQFCISLGLWPFLALKKPSHLFFLQSDSPSLSPFTLPLTSSISSPTHILPSKPAGPRGCISAT